MKTPLFPVIICGLLASGFNLAAAEEEIRDPSCKAVDDFYNVLPQFAGGRPHPIPGLNYACNKIYCDLKAKKQTRDQLFRYSELLNEIDKQNILFDQAIPKYEKICKQWSGKLNGEGREPISKALEATTDLYLATERHIEYALEWAADADAGQNGIKCGDSMRSYIPKKKATLAKSAARFGNVDCELTEALKAASHMIR